VEIDLLVRKTLPPPSCPYTFYKHITKDFKKKEKVPEDMQAQVF
jgi:hypothetical protein